MEQRLVPYKAAMSIEGARVLVLAPHPGDEVFGCGGAIMRHVAGGDALHVAILSDGTDSAQQPACADMRRGESAQAAKTLGYGRPEFWGLPDRGIEYGERLVQRIGHAIQAFGADLVYAPSIYEMHPDHRALGMAALEAVRRNDTKLKLAMYEVGVPMLHPNLLLDISDLRERKQQAMACFAWQLKEQSYDQHTAALNRFRTYTLGSTVKAAEAYFLARANELSIDILELYAPEYQQQREVGLPIRPADVPLVSVLIRSMDRPTLKTALDSIALQTYANIEVVIVNARAEAHSALGQFCGRFPLRVVTAGQALARGQAANFGMQNAQGTYLIFLDDDDFFLPDHLAKLTHALLTSVNQGLRAAYTGVRLVDADGASVLVLDEPWEPIRLRGANYLPIHAVLFEQSLLDAGCRFNEALECLEDWEFWLQVAQFTAFKHVPGVSAIYRIGLGLSGLSQEGDATKHIVNRAAIFEAWQSRFTPLEWVQTFYWFEMARNQFSQLARDRHDEIKRLEELLAQTKHVLDESRQHLTHQLGEAKGQLADVTARLAETASQLPKLTMAMHNNAARANHLQQTIEAVINSTSWKVTGPLRFISRLLRGQHREAFEGLRRRVRPVGKKVYFWLPQRWRAPVLGLAYRLGGKLFSGMGHYEMWRQNAQYINIDFPAPPADALSGLVDIATIAELNIRPAGRIAIHIHIFYADLAPEFAKNLAKMPFSYDLYVSTPNNDVRLACEQIFKKLPYLNQLTAAVVPNRGRDIAPMFCTFGTALRGYDFIAHLHGKKSLYNKGATNGWREYLLENLLGSEPQIRRIFSLLTGNSGHHGAGVGVGFVYPQNFSQLPYQANTWLSNLAMGRSMCQRLGIDQVPTGYFNFPAGSMFWARMDAVAPLFDAHLRIEDFPEETGQTDATFAHCLERLFVLTANRSGFKAAILRDASTARWSPWGFEQYLARDKAHVESVISAADVQLVAFDIFDTLLVRPFLNPESIKAVIAKQVDGKTGDTYLAFRAQAESAARQRAGRDVSLDAIFAEFSQLSGLPPDSIAQLRQLEESAEFNAVMPRPEVIAMLQYAVANGKRVVLASDMYLPRKTIEAVLAKHGIDGWQALYLSSEIGLRKDSGKLYRHILAEENVLPGQMLMLGDNEHSDMQIPGDMGIKVCHILRPVELARAVPRLGALIDRALLGGNLNEQLTLGLIAQTNFQSLFHPNFDPLSLVPPTPRAIGYSVLGPIVLSFSQWLADSAQDAGVRRLYFLAREGKFLKQVYDSWTAHETDAPRADYLVLSRRAVTVPMLSSIENIYAIAQPRYFPNQVGNFLQERFGLTLSDDEWAELARKGLWEKDHLIEVIDGHIEHLKPLLMALESRILAQAQKEHPGLMAYLGNMGLNEEGKMAVVDVGYAATIQGGLNRLLKRKINGYYMLTDRRAEAVALEHGISCQGCFGHYVSTGSDAPVMLSRSFALEKLLSADDAQIVQYQVNSSGGIDAQVRHLSDEELSTRAIRAEVQQGALAFMKDAVALRTQLVADFTVPPTLARSLYETFIQDPSAAESAILSKLVLDDFYCGRGLVS